VGQESLRGQAEDRCAGILVLFAERLFLLWVENEYPYSEEVPLQAVCAHLPITKKSGKCSQPNGTSSLYQPLPIMLKMAAALIRCMIRSGTAKAVDGPPAAKISVTGRSTSSAARAGKLS
jgi:hypothetical protein